MINEYVVQNICREYNRIMHRKSAKTDVETASNPKYFHSLAEVQPYFAEYLLYTWRLVDEQVDQEIDNRTLKAFCVFGGLDIMRKSIQSYNVWEKHKKIKSLVENWELLQDVMKDHPSKWKIKLDDYGVGFELYKGKGYRDGEYPDTESEVIHFIRKYYSLVQQELNR